MTLTLSSVIFDIFAITLNLFGLILIAINASAIYKDRIRTKPAVSTKKRVIRITIGTFSMVYGLVFLLIARLFLFL